MISDVLARDDLAWADVVDPSAEDVDELRQRFGFHQLALDDVLRRHQRPKLDEYPDYYFGVVYAVRLHGDGARPTTHELQFFWAKNYLVTLRAKPFPEVDDLIARAQSGALAPIVTGDKRPVTIPDVMYGLLDAIVDSYFPVSDALAEWTDDIEEQMFAGRRQPRTLQSIFAVRKDLITLRKVVAPSREVINSLLRHDHSLFDETYYPYFQDIYDHTVRVIDTLDTYRDLLSTALDTYLSIVSNDVNQTVKTMTAVTAILMVDALVASVYGMNFDVMPELHWTYGYPWALGLMVIATLGLWMLFRRIRWL